MRVIAGTYRSRPLTAPRGMATRPTSDRLRETLFNVLAPHIEGARFADLYAGTGAVGIEALSRGAAHVTFVENSTSRHRRSPRQPHRTQNPQAPSNSTSAAFRQRSATSPHATRLAEDARRESLFTLVYLDPPWEDAAAYTQSLNLLAASSAALLSPDAIVIAEHARRGTVTLADTYKSLKRYRLLEQGDAALSFYRQEPISETMIG